MKVEHTECSEMSAYKIQTLGNYPEEACNILNSLLGLDQRIHFVPSLSCSPKCTCDLALERWSMNRT